MKVFSEKIVFSTKGEIELKDLTGKVHEVVRTSGVKNGLVHVFAPHATGVLILTEHEPSLDSDVRDFLEKIIPKHGGYRHQSNAHSHLRSMLLSPDKTLPIMDGQAIFGTWQSLVFVETDVYPRQRTIIMQVLGE
ncbi:MAG: secondary thiamine-phosphate synthase enzyme YjbQ [Candidatus Bathyarchaeota archaeon]|nr:secondary thiamine-phosphate synthase enzyme YjbQ [Candidatus Bathyarchaeum sp.]